jgi:hypothetical protein
MRGGLKGYTPDLAKLLGLTPAALYERQRALVRTGLLDVSEGRGPGSGVRTTAGSITMLIIAALATDSLSETEERSREIAEAAPLGADQCPITLTSTFFEALTSVLSSSGKAAYLAEVRVSRTAARAQIAFDTGQTAKFAGTRSAEPFLHTEAVLAREPLQAVAAAIDAMTKKDLAEEMGGQYRELSEHEIKSSWDEVMRRAHPKVAEEDVEQVRRAIEEFGRGDAPPRITRSFLAFAIRGLPVDESVRAELSGLLAQQSEPEAGAPASDEAGK